MEQTCRRRCSVRAAAFALVLGLLAACGGQTPQGGGSPSKSPAAHTTSPVSRGPQLIVERDQTLHLLAGTTTKRIAQPLFFPAGSRAAEPPLSVSADRSWVLVWNQATLNWFALPIAGGPPVRLKGSAKLPVWGPGNSIVYVADGDLHVMTTKGDDRVLLSQNPQGCCFSLTSSSNGHLLAMEVYDRTITTEQIWIARADGTGLRKIYSGAANGKQSVAWGLGFAPDESRLVTSNTAHPITLDLQGRARAMSGTPVLHGDGRPGYTWSRGMILVNAPTGSNPLAWEDPLTGSLSVFADPAGQATDAFESLDGTMLAISLMRAQDASMSVWLVSPNGSGLRQATGWGRSVHVDGWSSDGRWVVFTTTRTGQISALDVSTGSVRSFGIGRVRAVL